VSHELHITYYYNQRGPNHNQRNGRVGGKWVKWRERDTFLISTQRRAPREEEKKIIYIFDENSRDGKFLNYKFMKHKPF